MKWTGDAFMLIVVVWYASPTSWHIPKDLRCAVNDERDKHYVRPRRRDVLPSACAYIFGQLMCFVFCLAAENTSTSFEFGEVFAIENELSPGNFRNDRLVPFFLSIIPKRTRKKTTRFLLNDDFVYFSLEAFCLALLVRNRNTWYMIHDRISPLFSFTAILFCSIISCLCLSDSRSSWKKTFKKTGDFLGKFPNLPKSKHRSEKPAASQTSDILVIHEDVQAWVYPRSVKKMMENHRGLV